MANAGYSSDCILLTKLIQEQKQIKILPTDNDVEIIIKNKLNNLVLNDVISNFSLNDKKYLTHSAWEHKSKVLIKINQIRIKNWYFSKLKEQIK